ncbi:hypothetical protein [Crateriforma spongiae]|uniref:hypothetical protein n=1 Tax=Crateriforma spongiae TaxID=2724528 RepID=UPI001445054C|nr:hypothetical protein [Crateriforma spongiae]
MQRIAAGLGYVGEAVPGFTDVDLGGNHAIEHHSADLAIADRLNRDTDSAGVFIFGWANRFDRCVADEASQFHRAGLRIRDRRIETHDAADRDHHTGRVVHTNRCGVSQVSASTTATGQPIAVHRLGCR